MVGASSDHCKRYKKMATRRGKEEGNGTVARLCAFHHLNNDVTYDLSFCLQVFEYEQILNSDGSRKFLTNISLWRIMKIDFFNDFNGRLIDGGFKSQMKSHSNQTPIRSVGKIFLLAPW